MQRHAPKRTIKLAFLTTDNRDHYRIYDSPNPFFGTAPESLLEGLAENPCLEIHIISCTQRHMLSPKTIFGGVFFHSLHVPKWGWLRSGYLGCHRSVAAKLREIRPDIIHSHGTERDCAMNALGFPAPKVLTLHGNIRRIAKVLKSPPLSFWWLQAFLEGLVIPRFDGVICLSHHAQRQVEEKKARQTWVIPNAVHPAFFSIRRVPVLPYRILCLATVSPLKNQLGLIHALETFPLKVPYEVYFFGAADLKSQYGHAFFEALRKHPNFYFGGLLTRAALQNELSKAFALILPTREDNCPMVVLEAQAAGVPVIASNVGGLPDLISDGVTGLLTNPDHPETMALALGRLVKDAFLVEHLSQAGRNQAHARFHPKVVAAQHAEIYRSLIARR